ncbi:hypothetical protein COY28_00080 [Candidatus Woesearchaeota archaeon CG_4_10_14_0_2_um_filter_57_5]|nr:MAG: hypothetical protein AUJ68_05945 [Candidatus Woesearchaeota archaeon CG1_02_57_44]PIN68263.1 MAG: hypothetical protein COV94_05655 [Candidatus Woesearchaeota archaeon CG11_big_fil_rev_8_21_14_0_20_57_5]PIZ57583.1 MAG: hypothetical protein COY28_00080 [Candidatus Woesearchaeota archaeon CG_4_10_14_0_2_um_filter_57_5]
MAFPPYIIRNQGGVYVAASLLLSDSGIPEADLEQVLRSSMNGQLPPPDECPEVVQSVGRGSYRGLLPEHLRISGRGGMVSRVTTRTATNELFCDHHLLTVGSDHNGTTDYHVAIANALGPLLRGQYRQDLVGHVFASPNDKVTQQLQQTLLGYLARQRNQ